MLFSCDKNGLKSFVQCVHVYMSLEYAVDGIFSVKFDVFSFGVLAWRLHHEDMSRELVNPMVIIGTSLYLSKAMRSVQLGLLCVQKYLEDRPSMSSVVLLLGRDCGLPLPKHPEFFY
ncbi:hypothetical protein RJ639_003812 [Escallonia herrerae]|uniref:Uncharacterized protein n=1 Tax=Escallonia herrerae TaxID=1293975 RepID=A0AA89AW71_9ASTE|nr:hypothetical protein RJ639_003812 [Escallonia herrerae]